MAFKAAAAGATGPSSFPAKIGARVTKPRAKWHYVKPYYRFELWATRRVTGSEAVVANC